MNIGTKKDEPPIFKREKFGGLLVRRECWTLSLPAKIAGLIVLFGVGIFVLLVVHPFLALTDRVNGDDLVIEGWIHEWAVKAGIDEFKQYGYTRVYVTGGPAYGQGPSSIYDTLAHVGSTRLKAAGLPDESMQMVPGVEIGRDRTYNDALALRRWFEEHKIRVDSINVLTEGAHARRSRLLFERAFNREVKIGVIAVPNPNYDAKRWWLYSEGVRETIGETIAYLYAKFLFHPPKRA